MSDRYGITHDGYEFKVSQIAGVTVGGYKTEHEAQQNIEACEQDDLILKTARGLVKKAVDSLIRTHDYQSSSDTAPAIESRLATQAAEGWRPILMSTATVNTAVQVFLVLEKPIPSPYAK